MAERMGGKILIIVLIVLSLSCYIESAPRGNQEQEIEEQIDEFIEAVLECHNIPGLNLAVVADKQPFLSKGYGVKNLETGEPFTNKTLSVIASVSKAFVSTLVGIVLDETEDVSWNTPVRDVLGDWFYFHDSHRTSRATIRDLLSHRMGMPGHNHIRMNGFTARELMERLRFLEFSQEWREGPMYNNVLYGVATYAAETLSSGTVWEDIARQRLFAPLGMDATTFVHQAEDQWHEFAKGYQEDNGTLREISLEVTKAYYDTTSAAGSVSSTAEDMTKWLLMWLNDGQNSQGEQVVPTSVVQDVHTPATAAAEGPIFSKPAFPVSYTSEMWALGWMEGYYRGYKRSTHAGSRDGYRSLLNLLPDLGLGLFTSLNRDNILTQDFIHMYVLDLLMGVEPWVDIDLACGNFPLPEDKDAHVAEKQQRHHHHHNEARKELHDAEEEEYIGVYGNYAYGNATVFIDETSGLLTLNYGAAEWTLTQTAQDRFNAKGVDPFWYWEIPVSFDRDDDDLVTEVTLPFQIGAHPTFIRGLDMSTAPPPPEICP